MGLQLSERIKIKRGHVLDALKRCSDSIDAFGPNPVDRMIGADLLCEGRETREPIESVRYQNRRALDAGA